MIYFDVLLRHLPDGTVENHKTPQSRKNSPSQDMNPGPPTYAGGVLTTLALRIKTFSRRKPEFCSEKLYDSAN